MSILSVRGAREPWCISEDVSAIRALAIVALLRVLSHTERELMIDPYHFSTLTDFLEPDDVSKVLTFYTYHVGSTVGLGYRSPSLANLARWWFDRSGTSIASPNMISIHPLFSS